MAKRRTRREKQTTKEKQTARITFKAPHQPVAMENSSLSQLFGYDLNLIYGDLRKTLVVTLIIVVVLNFLWWQL